MLEFQERCKTPLVYFTVDDPIMMMKSSEIIAVDEA